MIKSAIAGHPKPVVFSYLRFSTPEQAKGDSQRRQLELTPRWAKRNGVPLNESLNFADTGVSAFRGRNAKEGSLARILDCIESGAIWPGCYLSIESLDRLSRQKPWDSVNLLQQILEAGVRVVTHMPSERIYDQESAGNTFELMEMILTFARAHEESEVKSQRLKSAWDSKRKNAAKKKVTAQSPSWLTPQKDSEGAVVGFSLNSRAETVRQIYEAAAEGSGKAAICKLLNERGVPTFGKSNLWQKSTVHNILTNRSVLGEYQSHRYVEDQATKKRIRQPVGEPIANYFPQAIDENLFYSVQAAIAERSLPRGKHANIARNLFVGLLHDVRNQCACHLTDKGSRSAGPAIVSNSSTVGSSEYLSFPYSLFEETVLGLVTEIDLKSVMAKRAKGIDKQLQKAVSDVAQIENRIELLKQQVKKRATKSLTDLLIDSDDELEQARGRLEALKRQQATPATEGLRTTKDLIQRLKANKSQADLRRKLRVTIRQFVDRIDLLMVKVNARDRSLKADLRLTSGKIIRIGIDTGTPAPDEWHRLRLDDFSQWPGGMKATQFEVVSSIENEILSLHEKGWQGTEIASKVGVGSSAVSRVLKRHGKSKFTRKSQDSPEVMTFHEAGNGWVKVRAGQRYFVGFGKLADAYPKLVTSRSREGTYQAANRWWKDNAPKS